MKIDDVRKLMIGKWKLDDGRQIEFVDDTNLVFTTRLGRKVKDIYRVSKDENGIKLSIPILLTLNCTIDLIDQEVLQFTEHGIIGQVTLKRAEKM
jgi:hypothetical protein